MTKLTLLNKVDKLSMVCLVIKLTLLNNVDKLNEVCMVTKLTLVNKVDRFIKEKHVTNDMYPR